MARIKLTIDVPALRERLGLSASELPDDPTNDQIAAALKGEPRRAQAARKPRIEDHFDATSDAGLKSQVALDHEKPLTTEEINHTVTAAVATGRFPAERADHYRNMLQQGGRPVADAIEEMVAVHDPDQAVIAAKQSLQDPGYPEHWLPGAQQPMVNPPVAPVDRARHGRIEIDASPTAPQPERDTVTFEEPGLGGRHTGGAGSQRDRELRKQQQAIRHPGRIQMGD